MTMDRPMSAFMLSATLHGVVIALLLLLGYAAKQQVRDMPRVLELVAGGGDDLGAKLAPKLGTPGVKLTVPPPPKMETPKAEAPPQVEPAPLQAPPAPKKAVPVAPTKLPEPKAPNFKQQLNNQIRAATKKAQKEIARERAAEKKRLADEEKKRLAEQKAQQAKMTKADFDRMNKTKAAAKTPPKVAKVTTDGIVDGVADGSVESKAGQGGKALVSTNDDEQLVWDTMFKERMRREFEPPPGMSDTLVARVEVTCNADGSLSGARIARTSGSRDFDNAILEAIRRVRLPAKPDKRTEKIQFDFTAKEQEN
jgi:colicin import membrane protein